MTADIIFRDELVVSTKDSAVIAICVGAMELNSLHPNQYSRRVCDLWKSNLTGRGVGMMDLDLDVLAATGEDQNRMKNFLRQISRTLREHGDCIPANVLNKHLAPSSQFVKDIPTAPILNVIERIEEALTLSDDDEVHPA